MVFVYLPAQLCAETGFATAIIRAPAKKDLFWSQMESFAFQSALIARMEIVQHLNNAPVTKDFCFPLMESANIIVVEGVETEIVLLPMFAIVIKDTHWKMVFANLCAQGILKPHKRATIF